MFIVLILFSNSYADTTYFLIWLFGHGFNKTPIYFPESSTDFIFAVFASNFGFVGVLALLAIIIYFDVNIIRLARRKIYDTDKYILTGIVAMLLFQQIQNMEFMTLKKLFIIHLMKCFLKKKQNLH